MSRSMLMAMQAALMMSSAVGMLDNDLRAGRSYKCKQRPQKKKMSFHEREKRKLKLNMQREARLKTFVIKGEIVLANSRKDAIKRYNHRHLED